MGGIEPPYIDYESIALPLCYIGKKKCFFEVKKTVEYWRQWPPEVKLVSQRKCNLFALDRRMRAEVSKSECAKAAGLFLARRLGELSGG